MTSLKTRSLALLVILFSLFTTILAQGEGNPLPDGDIKVADPNSPGSTIRVTISGTIVAIVLMVAGFLFTFFGHRFFRVTLFLAGFYVFSTIGWVALKNFEPEKGYGANSQWVYLGVAGIVGIIGGALFLCFWRLGFAALGGIAGFYFAIFVLSWASNGLISNGTGRTIFIVVCVIIGVLMTFFVERHVVILGTALVGSGSFFVGLDNFVLTGFSDAFIQFLSGKKNGFVSGDGYHVSGKVYGMLAGTLAMFVLGACFQYYKHRGPWAPKTHREPKYKGVEGQA